MNLYDNFFKCTCGKELNKRSRFAILLHAPKTLGTSKAYKEGKHVLDDLALYVCQDCAEKAYEALSDLLHSSFYMDYNLHRDNKRLRKSDMIGK